MLLPAAVIVWGKPRLMRWLDRSRLRPRPPTEARRMMHPRSILAMGIGLIACASAALFALAADDAPQASKSSWNCLVLALLFVPGLWVTAAYCCVRHELSDEGMQVKLSFRRPITFNWDDVEHVIFNERFGWYRITLRSEDKVRISCLLMGLPEFARTLLQHVPSAKVEHSTRLTLEDTAAGRLPPLK
jgi:hypothetical protein